MQLYIDTNLKICIYIYYNDLTKEPPQNWNQLEYFGIPKQNKTTDLDTMRWIGKTEVGQKWHSKTKTKITQKGFRTHNTLAYGLKKGCSTDDLVGLVRELLVKEYSWRGGEGIIVVVQDIKTAFDELRHGKLAKAYLERGASNHTTGTMLRELRNKEVRLIIPEAGTTELASAYTNRFC